MTETTQVIAPAIFKVGSLLSVTFHGWSGSATLTDDDAEAFGRRSESDFFGKNQVTLVSKDLLKPFKQASGSMDNFLSKQSLDFPIRGARLVPHGNIQTVIEELRKAHSQVGELARSFADEKYTPERDRRIRIFDERHPGMRNRFAKYFPPAETLRSKFGVSWIFYEIKDVDGLDAIMAEENNNFRGHMRTYLDDIAHEMRRKALEAAIAFRKAVLKESGCVRSTSVAAFTDFVDRFERNDFMNDVQLREMMGSLRTKISQVQDWTIGSDLASITEIREDLSKLIAEAEKEGEAAAITANFLGGDEAPVIPEPTEEGMALTVAVDSDETVPGLNLAEAPAPTA